jgi:outer membrane protein insertion porin family
VGRFVGGINTMIGANEGSVIFGCRLPNLVGRGERINTEYSIGSNSNKSTMVSFLKPLGGSWNAE